MNAEDVNAIKLGWWWWA